MLTHALKNNKKVLFFGLLISLILISYLTYTFLIREDVSVDVLPQDVRFQSTKVIAVEIQPMTGHSASD